MRMKVFTVLYGADLRGWELMKIRKRRWSECICSAGVTQNWTDGGTIRKGCLNQKKSVVIPCERKNQENLFGGWLQEYSKRDPTGEIDCPRGATTRWGKGE